MRVLCVYTNLSRELQPAPPIGLAYVATAARQAGHRVELCDLSTERRPLPALIGRMEAFAPEVVALSVRNIDNVVRQRFRGQLEGLDSVVEAVSSRRPRPWIVVGGPAISILGARSLDRIGADFAIVGEGEESFPALLDLLEESGAPSEGPGNRPPEPAGLEEVPGLCWRREGRIGSNPRRFVESFGASGLESWIRWELWERLGGTFPIQTKRGCRMSCIYCTYPLIEGHGERVRPVEEIVDELERVQRAAGPRTFELVDSTTNLPPSHLEAVCEEILRRGLRLRLTAMGMNPAAMTPTLLRLMKRAGFLAVMVTPESASSSVLRSLGKGFGTRKVLKAAAAVRDAGLPSLWFFMLGGPGESAETVEETLDFAVRHLRGRRFLSVVFTGIRVLPGTELESRLIARGELSPDADLSRPVFSLDPSLDEAWILSRIDEAIQENPSIVHAAEEPTSLGFRIFHRLLHGVGIAPPYWRFTPWILSLPPVRRARRRQPVWTTRVGTSP